MATSTSQTIQQLQSQATQKVQAVSGNFITTYFSHLGFLEFIGLAVSVIFFAIIVYFAIETGWAATRIDRFRDIVLRSEIPKKRAQESWRRIQEHFYRGGESDLKVAVLEADKLLNDALREAGVMGIQLGERLKKANTGQIPNLNELWTAHKLRNQIAHEPNFKLKRDATEKALNIYEEALRNLGIFEGQGK